MQKTPSAKLQPVTQPSESKIQHECVKWYKNTYCLSHHVPRCMIFSIPNEGRGSASAQLMATGLYPGAADLMVIHRRSTYSKDRWVPDDIRNRFSVNKVLFIECKTDEGKQSENQIKFQEHAEYMELKYVIVRSLDDFKRVIENL